MNDHTQKVRKTIANYTYDLNDIIGSGYSSKVYKGLNTKTDQVVAIKVISFQQLTTPISQSLLKNEIKVLQQISHQNLMKVYEIFESKNNTYLVCEYCNQGDLADQLDDQSLTETQALEIFSQITQGIKALHDKKIIHRDIKPANILKHDNVYKLADFGFAVIENQYESIIKKFNVGTPLYMAPETVEHNHYSEQSDIWSLGIVLYQMIYKEFPIKQIQNGDIFKKHQLVVTKLKSDTHISSKIKELLLGMLTLEPDKRLKAQEILDIIHKDTKRLLPKSHQNIPCKQIRTIASSQDFSDSKIQTHDVPIESKQIMKSQPDEVVQNNLLYRSQQQINLVHQQLLSKRNQNYTNLLQNTNCQTNVQQEKKQPVKIGSPLIVQDKSPLNIKTSGSEKFNLLVKPSTNTPQPLKRPELSPQVGRLKSQKSFETIESASPQPNTTKLKTGLVIEYSQQSQEKTSNIQQNQILVKTSNTQEVKQFKQINSTSNIKQNYIPSKIIHPNQEVRLQQQEKQSNIQQVFTKSSPQLEPVDNQQEQNKNKINQQQTYVPQKVPLAVEESECKQSSNQNSTNDTIKHNQLSQCQQITLDKISGANNFQQSPISKPQQVLRSNILAQNKSPLRVVQSQRTIATPPFKQSGINQLRNSQDNQTNPNLSCLKNGSPIIHYSSQTKPIQSLNNNPTSDFLSTQTKVIDIEETLSATIRPTYKFLNFLHITLKKFDSINTEERQKCYFLLKKLLAIKSKYIFKSCPPNIQEKLQYWIDNFESYYEKVESIFYITPDKTFESYFTKDISQYSKGFAQLLLFYLQRVNTILLWKELLVIQEILNENLNQFNDPILFARRWENDQIRDR